MFNYANFVKSFQTRLSKYDKPTVEQSLEQKILHDMDEADISKNEFKPFLLDLDLVRGSVFGKKKPRQGWALTIIRGFLRSMFAPFYWSYWCQHTSHRLATLIMLHFTIQFVQVLCFLLLDSETSLLYQDDIIVPCLLAVCLGILHTHIVAFHGGIGGSTNTVGDLGRGLLHCRGSTPGGNRPTAVNLLGLDGYSYDARKRDSGLGNADPFSAYESQPPGSQLHHIPQRKLVTGQRCQQHLGSKLHSEEEEADVEEEYEDEGSGYQQQPSFSLTVAVRNKRSMLHTSYNRSLLGGDDDDEENDDDDLDNLQSRSLQPPVSRPYRQEGDWLFGKVAQLSPRRSDDTVDHSPLDQRPVSPSPFSQYDPTSCGLVRRRYSHHHRGGHHRHGHEADLEDSEADSGSQSASNEQPHDAEVGVYALPAAITATSKTTKSSQPVVDLLSSASPTSTTILTVTKSQSPSSLVSVSAAVADSQVGQHETPAVPVHAPSDTNGALSIFTEPKAPDIAPADGAVVPSGCIGTGPIDWPFTIMRATVNSNAPVRSWSIDLPICCTKLQLSTTPTCYRCPLGLQHPDHPCYSSSTTGSSCVSHQLLPTACQSADTRLGSTGGTRWLSEPNLVLPVFNQLGFCQQPAPPDAMATAIRSPSSSSSSSLCSRARACLPSDCRKECAVPTEDRRNLIEPIEVDDICANPKSPSQLSASITTNRKVSHCQTNAPVNGVSDHSFISKSLINLSWASSDQSVSVKVPPNSHVLTANQTPGNTTIAQQLPPGTTGKASTDVSCFHSMNNEEDTVTVNNRRLNKYLNLFRQRTGNRVLVPTTCHQTGHVHSYHQHRGRVIARTRLSRSTTLPDSIVTSVGCAVLTPVTTVTTVPPRTLFVEPKTRQHTQAPRMAGPFLRSRINSCGSNGTTESKEVYHNESVVTDLRRGAYAPRSSKRRYIRTANTIRFCNHVKSGELKTSTSINRGQTASETEYERINSDIGSEIDSSSGPDENIAHDHPTTRSIIQSVATGNSAHTPQQQYSDDPLTVIVNCPKQQQRNRSVVSSSSSSSLTGVRLQATVDTDAGAFDVDLDVDSLRQTRGEDKSTAFRQPADVSLSNAVTDEPLATTIVLPVTVETFGGDPRNGDEFYRHFHHQPALAPPAGVTLSPTLEAAANEQSPLDPIALRYKYEHRPSESLTNQWGQIPFINTDTVRCYVWEGDRICKLNLSMFDIGWNVVRAVERQGVSSDYVMIGCMASLLLSLLSVLFHWEPLTGFFSSDNSTVVVSVENPTPLSPDLNGSSSSSLLGLQVSALVHLLQVTVAVLVGRPVRWLVWFATALLQTSLMEWCQAGWNLLSGRWLFAWLSSAELPSRIVVLLGIPIRFGVYGIVFLLLSIAEQTFQQRLLYAKYFFSLTSSRRARKYRLPHFRLNKLRHIKCWLTLRSYLKKRGPQRSVEHIIAAAFYVIFVLGLVMCSQLISRKEGTFFTKVTNWDIVGLTVAVTVYLHRLIIIGTKITKQYRNFSVIITEQINLYLCLEKKPHKKDELMSTFQVLRLVEGLIKEVDGPFRVCGWTVNPLVYNIFKLVLLSCFSSLLSQTFGFKLKLYKLKLNAANW